MKTLKKLSTTMYNVKCRMYNIGKNLRCKFLSSFFKSSAVSSLRSSFFRHCVDVGRFVAEQSNRGSEATKQSIKKKNFSLLPLFSRFVVKLKNKTSLCFQSSNLPILQSSKKMLCIFLVVCFFATSVCRDVAAAVSMPAVDATQYKQIFTDFILPYSYGKITKSHFAGTDRVVINIQDLHCHPQVQKNISNIIDMFDKKYGVTNVYLEGAYGDVSTKWLTENIKNDKKKSEILNKILETGKLTGAEYYSAASDKTEIIKGLEKKEPYLDNLKRFGDLLEKQDEIQIILKGIEESTAKVKKQYYTKRQYKIEELSKEYITGEMRPEKYYRLLSKHIEKLGIDLTKYENTYTYIKLLALQKQLDYKAITSQLQALVMILKEKLPYNAYKMLLDNTKNFEQTDKLYSYIIKLSKDIGLDVSANFKELNKYFNYIELSQKINPLDLLKEEERLTREINTRFSDTVAQREVVFLTHFEKYLKDYMSTKITSDDYEYYKENIETYKKLYNKYVDNKVFSLLKPYMDEVDTFYKINMDRNDYFTENIFDGIETYEIEDIKEEPKETNKIIENMDKVTRLDVIVTGGFHSQTVTEILQDQGVSYIVITPNVQGGVKEAEKTYYEIAKEQKEINFQTLAAALLSNYPPKLVIKALLESGFTKKELEFIYPKNLIEEAVNQKLLNPAQQLAVDYYKKQLENVQIAKLLESDDVDIQVLKNIVVNIFKTNKIIDKDVDDVDIDAVVKGVIDIITKKEQGKNFLRFFGIFKKDNETNQIKEVADIITRCYESGFALDDVNKFFEEANAAGSKVEFDNSKDINDFYYTDKDGKRIYLTCYINYIGVPRRWNESFSYLGEITEISSLAGGFQFIQPVKVTYYKYEYEIDEKGMPIPKLDDDGNPIPELDADGNKVKGQKVLKFIAIGYEDNKRDPIIFKMMEKAAEEGFAVGMDKTNNGELFVKHNDNYYVIVNDFMADADFSDDYDSYFEETTKDYRYTLLEEIFKFQQALSDEFSNIIDESKKNSPFSNEKIKRIWHPYDDISYIDTHREELQKDGKNFLKNKNEIIDKLKKAEIKDENKQNEFVGMVLFLNSDKDGENILKSYSSEEIKKYAELIEISVENNRKINEENCLVMIGHNDANIGNYDKQTGKFIDLEHIGPTYRTKDIINMCADTRDPRNYSVQNIKEVIQIAQKSLRELGEEELTEDEIAQIIEGIRYYLLSRIKYISPEAREQFLKDIESLSKLNIELNEIVVYIDEKSLSEGIDLGIGSNIKKQIKRNELVKSGELNAGTTNIKFIVSEDVINKYGKDGITKKLDSFYSEEYCTIEADTEFSAEKINKKADYDKKRMVILDDRQFPSDDIRQKYDNVGVMYLPGSQNRRNNSIKDNNNVVNIVISDIDGTLYGLDDDRRDLMDDARNTEDEDESIAKYLAAHKAHPKDKLNRAIAHFLSLNEIDKGKNDKTYIVSGRVKGDDNSIEKSTEQQLKQDGIVYDELILKDDLRKTWTIGKDEYGNYDTNTFIVSQFEGEEGIIEKARKLQQGNEKLIINITIYDDRPDSVEYYNSKKEELAKEGIFITVFQPQPKGKFSSGLIEEDAQEQQEEQLLKNKMEKDSSADFARRLKLDGIDKKKHPILSRILNPFILSIRAFVVAAIETPEIIASLVSVKKREKFVNDHKKFKDIKKLKDGMKIIEISSLISVFIGGAAVALLLNPFSLGFALPFVIFQIGFTLAIKYISNKYSKEQTYFSSFAIVSTIMIGIFSCLSPFSLPAIALTVVVEAALGFVTSYVVHTGWNINEERKAGWQPEITTKKTNKLEKSSQPEELEQLKEKVKQRNRTISGRIEDLINEENSLENKIKALELLDAVFGKDILGYNDQFLDFLIKTGTLLTEFYNDENVINYDLIKKVGILMGGNRILNFINREDNFEDKTKAIEFLYWFSEKYDEYGDSRVYSNLLLAIERDNELRISELNFEEPSVFSHIHISRIYEFMTLDDMTKEKLIRIFSCKFENLQEFFFAFSSSSDGNYKIEELIELDEFLGTLKEDDDIKEIKKLIDIVRRAFGYGENNKLYTVDNCFVLKMFLNKDFRKKFKEHEFLGQYNYNKEYISPDQIRILGNKIKRNSKDVSKKEKKAVYFLLKGKVLKDEDIDEKFSEIEIPKDLYKAALDNFNETGRSFEKFNDDEKEVLREVRLIKEDDLYATMLYRRAGAFGIWLHELVNNKNTREQLEKLGISYIDIDYDKLLQNKEAMDYLMNKFFDDILSSEVLNRPYIKKGVKVIGAAHQEDNFVFNDIRTLDYLLDLECDFSLFKYGKNITKPDTMKKTLGKLIKENIYHPEGLFFIFDGHGSKDGLWLDHWDNISPKELAEMFAYDEKGEIVKNLSNVTIELSSCYSYYFAKNLEYEFEKLGIEVMPNIISAGGYETELGMGTASSLFEGKGNIGNFGLSLVKHIEILKLNYPELVLDKNGTLTNKDVLLSETIMSGANSSFFPLGENNSKINKKVMEYLVDNDFIKTNNVNEAKILKEVIENKEIKWNKVIMLSILPSLIAKWKTVGGIRGYFANSRIGDFLGNEENAYKWEELVFRTAPALAAIGLSVIGLLPLGVILFAFSQIIFLFSHTIVKWITQTDSGGEKKSFVELAKDDFKNLKWPTAVVVSIYLISFAISIFVLPAILPFALPAVIIQATAAIIATVFSADFHRRWNKDGFDDRIVKFIFNLIQKLPYASPMKGKDYQPLSIFNPIKSIKNIFLGNKEKNQETNSDDIDNINFDNVTNEQYTKLFADDTTSDDNYKTFFNDIFTEFNSFENAEDIRQKITKEQKLLDEFINRKANIFEKFEKGEYKDFNFNYAYIYYLYKNNKKEKLKDYAENNENNLKYRLFAVMYLKMIDENIELEIEDIKLEFEKEIEKISNDIRAKTSIRVINNFDLRSFITGIMLFYEEETFFNLYEYKFEDLDVSPEFKKLEIERNKNNIKNIYTTVANSMFTPTLESVMNLSGSIDMNIEFIINKLGGATDSFLLFRGTSANYIGVLYHTIQHELMHVFTDTLNFRKFNEISYSISELIAILHEERLHKNEKYSFVSFTEEHQFSMNLIYMFKEIIEQINGQMSSTDKELLKKAVIKVMFGIQNRDKFFRADDLDFNQLSLRNEIFDVYLSNKDEDFTIKFVEKVNDMDFGWQSVLYNIFQYLIEKAEKNDDYENVIEQIIDVIIPKINNGNIKINRNNMSEYTYDDIIKRINKEDKFVFTGFEKSEEEIKKEKKEKIKKSFRAIYHHIILSGEEPNEEIVKIISRALTALPEEETYLKEFIEENLENYQGEEEFKDNVNNKYKDNESYAALNDIIFKDTYKYKDLGETNVEDEATGDTQLTMTRLDKLLSGIGLGIQDKDNWKQILRNRVINAIENPIMVLSLVFPSIGKKFIEAHHIKEGDKVYYDSTDERNEVVGDKMFYVLGGATLTCPAIMKLKQAINILFKGNLSERHNLVNTDKEGYDYSLGEVAIDSVKTVINPIKFVNSKACEFGEEYENLEPGEYCFVDADVLKNLEGEETDNVYKRKFGGKERGGVVIGSVTVSGQEHLVRLKLDKKNKEAIFYSNTINLENISNIKEKMEELTDEFSKEGNKNLSKENQKITIAYISSEDNEVGNINIENKLRNKKNTLDVTQKISAPRLLKAEEIKRMFKNNSIAEELEGLKKLGYTSFYINEEEYENLTEKEKLEVSKEKILKEFVAEEKEDVNSFIERLDKKEKQTEVTIDLTNVNWNEADLKQLEKGIIEKYGINLTIQAKYSESTLEELKGKNAFEEIGILPLIDVEKINEYKIEGKKGIYNITDAKQIEGQTDVVCLMFDQVSEEKLLKKGINTVKEIIESVINKINSPQSKFEIGKNRALNDQEYKLEGNIDETVKQLENLLTLDVSTFLEYADEETVNNNIKEMIQDNLKLFNPVAQSYIQEQINKGKYIEALGFIRGVVENSITDKMIDKMLGKDINDNIKDKVRTDIQTNETQGLLSFTIWLMLNKEYKDKDVITMLFKLKEDENFEYMSAKDVYEKKKTELLALNKGLDLFVRKGLTVTEEEIETEAEKSLSDIIADINNIIPIIWEDRYNASGMVEKAEMAAISDLKAIFIAA